MVFLFLSILDSCSSASDFSSLKQPLQDFKARRFSHLFMNDLNLYSFFKEKTLGLRFCQCQVFVFRFQVFSFRRTVSIAYSNVGTIDEGSFSDSLTLYNRRHNLPPTTKY